MQKKTRVIFFIILAIAVTVIAIGIVSLNASHPSGSWRYKMTVVVETPEGIKTGSAVRELYNATGFIDLPDVGGAAVEAGEAVVVDLGKRGVLFALPSRQSGSEFYQAFPVPGGGSTTANGIRYYKNLKPGLVSKLDPNKYPGWPRMVAFKDIHDPKSVELVYEPRSDEIRNEKNQYLGRRYHGVDRMEQVFGKGVVLKDVTIETTDEAVTKGNVDKYLTENFLQAFRNWMKSLNISERGKYVPLFYFKKGEK